MLKVIKYDNSYYINLSREIYFCAYDDQIAKELNISLQQYQGILISHGAILKNFHEYSECCFNNLWTAERALEALTPYIIINNLVGDI